MAAAWASGHLRRRREPVRCRAPGPSTLARSLRTSPKRGRCRDLDDPSALFLAVLHGYPLAICSGQFDLASEHWPSNRSWPTGSDGPLRVERTYSQRPSATARRSDEGEELAAPPRRWLRRRAADALAYYGVQLMAARRLQGRYGEVAPLIADAAERTRRYPRIEPRWRPRTSMVATR